MLCAACVMSSPLQCIKCSEVNKKEGPPSSQQIIEEELSKDSDPTLNEQTPEDIFSQLDMDDLFKSMQESLISGKEFSFSDAFKGFAPSENIFDQMEKKDHLDYGLVNMQYQMLTDKMLGAVSEKDTSGKAMGCYNLFDQTYGGIREGLTLSEPTLPEGFSLDEMIANQSKMISNTYQSAISSEGFSGVKAQISIGNVFEIAKHGVYTDVDFYGGFQSSKEVNYNKERESYESHIPKNNVTDPSALHTMQSGLRSELIKFADVEHSVFLPKPGEDPHENARKFWSDYKPNNIITSSLGKFNKWTEKVKPSNDSVYNTSPKGMYENSKK